LLAVYQGIVIQDHERVFQLLVPTEALGEVRVGTYLPYIINPQKYFVKKKKIFYLLKIVAVQMGLIL
jgi:hypothetical protein